MITPYCWNCKLPATRICFDVVSSPYSIGIHAQCCDRTSSMRLPIEKFLEMRATGQKLFVLTPKTSMPGLRPLPKADLAYRRADQ